MTGRRTLLIVAAIVLVVGALVVVFMPPLSRRPRETKALPEPRSVTAIPPDVGPPVSPDPVPRAGSPRKFTRPPAAIEGPGVAQPAPADPLQTVADIVEALPWGDIAFTAPNSVRLESEHPIQLLLSQEFSAEALRARLPDPESAETARVQISNVVEARLTGQAFRIVPVTPERQAVSPRGTTEWKWTVVALEPGPQHLHLVLSAVISVDEERVPGRVQTFQRRIAVEVTTLQRLKRFTGKNWQWSFVVILVPIGRWSWKRYKRRTKPTDHL